jgi:hypothetical protein
MRESGVEYRKEKDEGGRMKDEGGNYGSIG